jgi:hypothetical protein
MVGPHTEFTKEVNRMKIRMRRSEVGRSNQNYAAEREIGELKKRWRNRMLRQRVPKWPWDFGLLYESYIKNRIPRGKKARTSLEMIIGETPDMSEWTNLSFTIQYGYMTTRKLNLMAPGGGLPVGLA